ncbi:ribosomal protein S5 domain 2-type protein [Polychytrium aggregatum]|uniref:ribosomal protein S5 domain 2-type protein n=1 Tax=Polychytrium aggregatum TaxID=110093 RepID=UPI0022FED42A|nr:ribosomal protein S5 domain 2-type protein [Polychytrium aggregatum]KAI9205338.1 ribosomal protein S5 domain 2-type protein [Polychytrium aggregatum]
MSRHEIVSPEGLRVDGRRPGELRRINCRTGIFTQADGSAYIEIGNTKCLAAVYGPREPQKKGQAVHDRAFISVEFNVASFSSGEHKEKLRQDRRLLELGTTIRQTFEPVIMAQAYARSEIAIFIQILQTDGGILHTAINATTLALIDAGIAMTDYVAACSSGFANDHAILDLNYIEEMAEVPALTMAILPKTGKVTMLGLEARLHLDHFEATMNLANDGCAAVLDILDEAIRKITKTRAQTIS